MGYNRRPGFAKSIKPFAASWESEYVNEGILDGIQWSVKIVIDDVSLKCEGSNDFPEDFDEFWRILCDLTGISMP